MQYKVEELILSKLLKTVEHFFGLLKGPDEDCQLLLSRLQCSFRRLCKNAITLNKESNRTSTSASKFCL